jgi:hypothetical protein
MKETLMSSPQLVRLILSAAVCGSLILGLVLTLKSATIEVSAKTQQDERKLEDEIPRHVPLRAKIKKEKEKEFKNLNNERWARDFELEVTNIGDKPIYEFYLLLVLDIKDVSGQNVLAPVYFGRTELGDIRVKATPDDVPIRAGESVILKIHPGELDGWDIVKRKENWQVPKIIRVKFQFLNCGDGTGYSGSDGGALPRRVG